MAKLYDLMLLVDPNAPDGRQDQVVQEVRSMIESGGNLVGAHDWGERRMAYEMDHRPDAHYHLFQFESENDLLERLQHSLKIMDGVLRFRIIRLKPGSPPPQPPRDSAPRPREEREPEGRVAARAAADAPAEGEAAEAAPGEAAPAEVADAAPAEVATEPAPAEPAPAEPAPAEAPAEVATEAPAAPDEG
jgi:small subunit ribosomal protein S6